MNAVTKILIPIMCFALLIPTLEHVVVGLDLLSDLDFSLAELVEAEEENTESEKEDKKEKEVELALCMQWHEASTKVFSFNWAANNQAVRTMIREIPSPPPDSII